MEQRDFCLSRGKASRTITLFSRHEKQDRTTQVKRIALLFSGQGAQHVGMGRDLADANPEIAHMYQVADEILGLPLKKACWEGPAELLTETAYCQPALFLHGIALLKLLQQIHPTLQFEATAGLSLGEFTAHAAAGTFTWQEGLALVGHRGRLMQEACDKTEGSMLSLLGASEEDAESLARVHDLQIANYNCPGQIVLSGLLSSIQSAAKNTSAFPSVKRAIPLKVAGAYHSRLMALAQEGLAPYMAKIPIHLTSVKVTSNVTGQFVQSDEEVASTLLRQVTGSVRWETCIRTLISEGIEHFIELGPGQVLAGLCKRISKDVPCSPAGNLKELETISHELK